MGKVLTEREIARYQEDGVVHPITILSSEEAGRYREALEAAEAEHPGVLDGAGRNNLHLVFPFLDEIVHHPRLLDAVEDLIGPDILVWGTVLFLKEARDPGFVSWHQDATHMGLEPHAGVTAWLALTPSTVTTGCMRMLPGSHREALRPHQDTFEGNNILTRGQTIENLDEAAAVDLVLKPGEVSFHHQRTIHSSMPNQGDVRRIGFVIQSYLPPQVRQIKGLGFAQDARGQDPYNYLSKAPRPRYDLEPDSVALRERVNTLWAEQLYQGAKTTRDL